MIIKHAADENEFLQIHQLNYKTFVEEIPQNVPNENKFLVDKFHYKNNYIIAKKGEQVIGMVCFNQQRPFSLEGKMEAMDSYLPPHQKLAEIRLLSVVPGERNTTVTYKLLKYLCTELIKGGTDSAVISGTTRQLSFYTHLGFIPFGSVVGNAGAYYQPMYITLNKLLQHLKHD